MIGVNRTREGRALLERFLQERQTHRSLRTLGYEIAIASAKLDDRERVSTRPTTRGLEGNNHQRCARRCSGIVPNPK